MPVKAEQKTESKLNFLKIIFFVGIFLMPLIFLPGSRFPFEIPRVWFIDRWIEILAVVGFFYTRYVKRVRKDTISLVLVLFFVFLALLSSFLGPDVSKSYLGNIYRADGLSTLFHLVALYFIIFYFWGKSWEKPFVIALSASSVIVSISSILFGPEVLFGHRVLTAGFLAITSGFLLSLFEDSKNSTEKVIWAVSLTLVIISVLLSKAAGAMLALVITFIGYCLLKLKVSKTKLFVTLAIIGLSILVFYFASQDYTKFQPQSRTRIMAKSLLAFSKRPLLGYGWSNFDHAFESVDWPIKLQHDVYVDKAHSTFLEILVTTGLIGFMVYMLIIGRAIWAFLREKGLSNYIFLAFLVLLIHAQTNVISIAEELVFWILLGITSSDIG